MAKDYFRSDDSFDRKQDYQDQAVENLSDYKKEAYMKEIHFRCPGDRLRICIIIGNAQIGSYRLRLWESASNTVVMDEHGNNQNPNDDCYDLPLPLENNNGRLVQCEFSVVSPDPQPGDQYSVSMDFLQGKHQLDSVDESGPMNGKRVSPELWAVLKTP